MMKKNEWIETIEGVTAVHTGSFREIFLDEGKIERVEKIRFYNSVGDEFYSNFNSAEEAEKAVERLKNKGTIAYIGPKAPWYSPSGLIPNRSESSVGVYIKIKGKDPESRKTNQGLFGPNEEVQVSNTDDATVQPRSDGDDELTEKMFALGLKKIANRHYLAKEFSIFLHENEDERRRIIRYLERVIRETKNPKTLEKAKDLLAFEKEVFQK